MYVIAFGLLDVSKIKIKIKIQKREDLVVEE